MKKTTLFATRLNYCMKIQRLRNKDIVAATGISKASIANYKSGNYKPFGKNLEKIAETLSVDANWLVGNDEITSSINDSEISLIETYRLLNDRNRIRLESYADNLRKLQTI